MKRSEHRSHLTKMPLPDLRREILELERKIQAQKVTVVFGKTKEVTSIRNLRRELAQSLTIAHQKLNSTNSLPVKKENDHE